MIDSDKSGLIRTLAFGKEPVPIDLERAETTGFLRQNLFGDEKEWWRGWPKNDEKAESWGSSKKKHYSLFVCDVCVYLPGLDYSSEHPSL